MRKKEADNSAILEPEPRDSDSGNENKLTHSDESRTLRLGLPRKKYCREKSEKGIGKDKLLNSLTF